MYPKVDLRKRSRKGSQKALRIKMKWMTFGSHFPSKIDEKIDAKIDAEQIMKIYEKTMQNCPEIDMKFNIFRKLLNLDPHLKKKKTIGESPQIEYESNFKLDSKSD